MLNRIFVVDSVTLTSTGAAVSSYVPWDQSTRKLPTQVVIKATGQGAYVRLSNDNSAATNADVLVQGGDHVVLSVQGRRWVSVLSDGASSTVNVGALSTGVSGSAASLDLPFTGVSALDSSITFTRASSATFVGSNGLIQSATTNTPRFDYDPVTLAAKGLLIEEQRTNLLTYSEQFDNAAWTKGNVTVSANSTTAPDGTITADTLIENTANNNHELGLTPAAIPGGVTVVSSIYVKRASGTRNFRLTMYSGADGVRANYDLTALTATNGSYGASTFVSASIQDVGNNWYRLILVGSVPGASPFFNPALLNGTTSFYTGDGTSGVFLWGAQLEAGSFATSYIPTVASQVTRAADVASVNTLSPWYNATEGTLYVEGGGLNAASSARLAGFSDGTFSNRIINYLSGSTQVAGLISTGGVAQANPTVNVTAASSANKVAIGYAANNVNVAANGTLGTLDTSASIPTVTLMRIGADEVGTGAILNGTIRRITYFPRRLSNAELQALTA